MIATLSSAKGLTLQSILFVLYARARSTGHFCARFLLLALVGLAPAQAMAPEPVRILALGTSLTAGYGLPAEEGFVDQLTAALAEKGYTVEIVNAGVSGDTSAGGLARVEWILDDSMTHAIVELGSNDALRGLSPAETRNNLDAILKTLTDRGLPVLLAGMLAPRNLGPDYAEEFDAIYPGLSAQYGVPLYPFFLDGVAVELDLNQPDGIHPNKDGVAVIVERMLPFVLDLIDPARQAVE